MITELHAFFHRNQFRSIAPNAPAQSYSNLPQRNRIQIYIKH